MKSDPYVVIARAEAKPGKEQELEATLTALIEPTRQEQGCLGYELHKAQDNPAQFMFYESWKDDDAFKLHHTQPHMLAWKAKKDDLLVHGTEVTFWQKIELQY